MEAVPTGVGGSPEDAGRASGSMAAGDQGLVWSPVLMAGDCRDLRCPEDDHQDSNFPAADSPHSAVFPAVRPARVAYWAADWEPARTLSALP